jgi:hypothetical protein
MQWTAPTIGIAMCHIAVALEQQRESAYGYERTFSRPKSTSAVPPTTDIPAILVDFRC